MLSRTHRALQADLLSGIFQSPGAAKKADGPVPVMSTRGRALERMAALG